MDFNRRSLANDFTTAARIETESGNKLPHSICGVPANFVWNFLDGKGNVVLDFTDADLDGTAEDHELSARQLWGQRVDELFAQEEVSSIASDGVRS